MPNKEVLQEVDVRDLILEHLKSIERDLGWLAKKLGRPYSTMYSIMVLKTARLAQDCLDKINEILGTNY